MGLGWVLGKTGNLSLFAAAFFGAFFLSTPTAADPFQKIQVWERRAAGEIVHIPGVLEEESALDFRLSYSDARGRGTSRHIHFEQADEAQALLHSLKVAVRQERGPAAIALSLYLVADLSGAVPEVRLAVRYISGAVGTSVVALEDCSPAGARAPESPMQGELPQWLMVRVKYSWMDAEENTITSWTYGRAFLRELKGTSPGHLIPMADVIYAGRDRSGRPINESVQVALGPTLEAFSISQLPEPVALASANGSELRSATVKELALDLTADEPAMGLLVEQDGTEVDVSLSRIKGLGGATCRRFVLGN